MECTPSNNQTNVLQVKGKVVSIFIRNWMTGRGFLIPESHEVWLFVKLEIQWGWYLDLRGV